MKKTQINTEIIPDFSCVTMMRDIRNRRDGEMEGMTREERLRYLGVLSESTEIPKKLIQRKSLRTVAAAK
jgi:hypothetical protein